MLAPRTELRGSCSPASGDLTCQRALRRNRHADAGEVNPLIERMIQAPAAVVVRPPLHLRVPTATRAGSPWSTPGDRVQAACGRRNYDGGSSICGAQAID